MYVLACPHVKKCDVMWSIAEVTASQDSATDRSASATDVKGCREISYLQYNFRPSRVVGLGCLSIQYATLLKTLCYWAQIIVGPGITRPTLGLGLSGTFLSFWGPIVTKGKR